MRIINGIILFGLSCFVLFLCTIYFMTGFATSYDVIEYDIEKEYFVYIDNEENIERVSLNEDIEIMTSDKNYVWVWERTYFGVLTTTEYDLYLNTSTMGVIDVNYFICLLQLF